MTSDFLTQLLILLASSVLVVAAFRRFGLPLILGYLAVGIVLGPSLLDVARSSETTGILAEFGVVFLVFTLGLEFSLPRMLAMRREVLGIGGAQMVVTMGVLAAILWTMGERPVVAALVGGALAMSSTAIVIRQLGDQLELNHIHGRLAVGILLFQDLAFVPLLAIQNAAHGSTDSLEVGVVLAAMARGAVALLVVLALGKWILRPMFHEIGRARSMELFTLTVLLVALACAWITHAVGLSLALGAFLAGMMLGETEYRQQIEAVIRPFRDIFLGLFFITVGMLLDLQLVAARFGLVLVMVTALLVIKAGLVAGIARMLGNEWSNSMRAGLVVAQGGEFGFALLTLMLADGLVAPDLMQPLLAATVISMALGTLLIRHNHRIAGLLTRSDHTRSELQVELAATRETARRDHVILCGFGRVGQNLARVLERQSFDYIALDLDPRSVRAARQGGDPVMYGDSAEPEMLKTAGITHCRVLVITFSDPEVSLRVLRSARELRADIPVLIRTPDDSKLEQLQSAGATEVVPETLEASLMLMSHLLLLLKVPLSRVVKTVDDIRGNRYAMLRRVFREAEPSLDGDRALREELRTLALPPRAHAVGKSIGELDLDALGASITAVRRQGVVVRQPSFDTILRGDDVVVLYGTPESLDRGESRLLTG